MGRLKADQSAMPFISALKCQLYNIHKHFNEVVLGEKEYNRHYTIKLLLELEKLCQASSPFNNNLIIPAFRKAISESL